MPPQNPSLLLFTDAHRIQIIVNFYGSINLIKQKAINTGRILIKISIAVISHPN